MSTTMRLDLEEADSDDGDLDRSTRQLREQLLELDIEDARTAPAEAGPAGSKSGLGMVIGGLLVTLAQTPQILGSVLSVIATWVSARAGRSVKITLGGDTLELSAASADERQALIQSFLDKHLASSGADSD